MTPLKADIECIVELRMKHDYVYTIIQTPISPNESGDKSTPTKETKWISHFIRLNIGNVSI